MSTSELYSVPSYPATSFHTTPEYLNFVTDPETTVQAKRDRRSTSSSHTLKMSYHPHQSHPAHPRPNANANRAEDFDDGYPDEDEDLYVISRIKGLETLQSPEARHKVLPWLDEVPRGKRPDDERSFAGGSVRTGGILKPTRKPLPPDATRPSPPPIGPLPATPQRSPPLQGPATRPSLPSRHKDESESAVELLRQLDGTATDVSRLEREGTRERSWAASGTVPSPFAQPEKELHKQRSRAGEDLPSAARLNDLQQAPMSSRDPEQEVLARNTSRNSHRPQAPPFDAASSTTSFGNVDHPDRDSRRRMMPVTGPTKPNASSPARHTPAPRVPTPQPALLPERDNDSTRTILPSASQRRPEPSASARRPVPSPLRHQQLVRSSRPQSVDTTGRRASLFHDRALCELLEASAQPGIGEEVKKVLRVAVEKRVAELAREVSRQDGFGVHAGGRQSEEAPPAWAADLLDRLEANQTRLETIMRSLSLTPTDSSFEPIPSNLIGRPRSPNAFITPLSPVSPTQDVPADSFPSSTRPLGTSLAIFTESPADYETPGGSIARHTFGDPISAATTERRGIYAAVDPAIFHPVGPPGASLAPASSHRTDRLNTPPALPMAPQILVQAPSTHRSRTPVATPSGAVTPIVAEPVLPSAQNVKGKDFADRDLPAIPPEVPSDSEESEQVFAFKPPPVKDDRNDRPRTSEGRAEEKRRETEPWPWPEDPILPSLPEPRPWDLVSQRLNAWAIIWTLEDFTKALEDISLSRQVNTFALTIWTTTTYKRQLRHRICSEPSEVVDKLFVPPSMGDALNQACYHKRFNDGKMIIEELWTPFNLPSLCPTGFPRIILAICRHRNEDDTWAVHRFDLSSSTMRTFLFYAEGERKKLPDGRPFSWWHGIRAAYPNAGIKDPDGGEMGQKTDHVQLPSSSASDASLHAVNCWRNLLMGWRWDRPTDLPKLRELIWMETKRVMGRKAGGRLVAGEGEV